MAELLGRGDGKRGNNSEQKKTTNVLSWAVSTSFQEMAQFRVATSLPSLS